MNDSCDKERNVVMKVHHNDTRKVMRVLACTGA